jgi:NhaP-type Na+/H+ or K+/H+ antiporter
MSAFAHRDLIILVAFSVIVVTLVGQGLSLAPAGSCARSQLPT